MQEVKIGIQQAFQQQPNPEEIIGDAGSCSESEPFALQVIDDSMQPEFDQGCIIIIDPTGIVRDGAYVFAKDLNDEYIFRRLRLQDNRYTLEALNPAYESFDIAGQHKIEGVITQRAGRRRSYHKRYD